MKPYLIVCNWKSYFLYNQAQGWFEQYSRQLSELKTTIDLVICPSFEALAAGADAAKNGAFLLGAQTCSAYGPGAHTGDVLANSLKEIGCSYCIVGHSEQRQEYHITIDYIIQQLLQLLNNTITPILCVGETADERQEGQSEAVLHAQLVPVFEIIKKEKMNQKTLIIAYEPIWAIGTDKAAEPETISKIFDVIENVAKQYDFYNYRLLYGGSVSDSNLRELKTIPKLKGFLIGRASTDFQRLKKIVSCL